MSVTEAMEAESDVCRLEESIGRISAEFGYLYPPGIPLIVPGEQITGQFIRNMRIYMEEGLYLQGLEDYTNQTIRGRIAPEYYEGARQADFMGKIFFILWEKCHR